MTRTVVSFNAEDKEWLDRVARERDVPMTQVVREAVRRFRLESSMISPDFKHILRETTGIWHKGDGLAFQMSRRREWDRHR